MACSVNSMSRSDLRDDLQWTQSIHCRVNRVNVGSSKCKLHPCHSPVLKAVTEVLLTKYAVFSPHCDLQFGSNRAVQWLKFNLESEFQISYHSNEMQAAVSIATIICVTGCDSRLWVKACDSGLWVKHVIQACDPKLRFKPMVQACDPKLVIRSLWFKPVSHRQAIDNDSPEWSAEWSLIHRWYIGADCLLVAFKRLPISLQNLFYKRFVHRSAKAFAKGSCNRFQRASLFEPLSKSFSNRESLLKSLFKFYCSSSSIRVTIEVSIQVLLFRLLF